MGSRGRRWGAVRGQGVGKPLLARGPSGDASEPEVGPLEWGLVVPPFRNVSTRSATAGPRTSAWMSCHGGRGPNAGSSTSACGSPSWRSSSRRPWQRSMPPTKARSSPRRAGCRSNTSFWWCDPPRRMRASRSRIPPASFTTRASALASPSLNPNIFGCERQSSPRILTPRVARPESRSPRRGPSRLRSSSSSPRQSTSSTWSSAPSVERQPTSREKYVAPWISGST